jgi:hypothetical protein
MASQVVSKRNLLKNIGTWKIRSILNTSKLKNIELEMKRLDINILGVSHVR